MKNGQKLYFPKNPESYEPRLLEQQSEDPSPSSKNPLTSIKIILKKPQQRKEPLPEKLSVTIDRMNNTPSPRSQGSQEEFLAPY